MATGTLYDAGGRVADRQEEIDKHTRARAPTCAHPLRHTHARARTRAHIPSYTHTHIHTRAPARAHTYPHTHTHTHAQRNRERKTIHICLYSQFARESNMTILYVMIS